MDFSEDQIHRYARHILLPEIGGVGQSKLLDAKVLVIGTGGLGSPVSMYLTAAGVGTVGIVDDDVVDLSNLQRQIAHATSRVGVFKVESAAQTLSDLNPDVTIHKHRTRLTADNALDLISRYDVVADCTDNFDTRFLINDACYFARVPLVSGAILRFDGQVATYRAFEDGDRPCYRCIFRAPPPPGQIPTCAEAGVLGAMCGLIGSMQATEIVKELLGIGDSMAGKLLICDALSMSFRKITVHRDSGCPLCGDAPEITDLSSHRIATGERVCHVR